MIQSMTGFGNITLTSDNYKVTVELKSLNSKYIELNLKVPKTHIGNEIPLRNLLTKALKRGKVSALMTVEVLNPDFHKLPINRELVKKYAADLSSLQKELGLDKGPSLEFLLTLPDAMVSDSSEADPEEWNLIERAFREATEKLVNSRIVEGKALWDDLIKCSETIENNLSEVESRIPQRTQVVRDRIRTALDELKSSYEVDQNRFEQELIYYIEKLDLNEEIVRLRKHMQTFRSTVAEGVSNGKRLGFMAQEMGREINTIGSKANDAEIQVFVVQMKEALEKIKEQVLNIL